MAIYTKDELDNIVNKTLNQFTGNNADLKNVLTKKIPEVSYDELAYSMIRLACKEDRSLILEK
jgi:hypothetical protein